MAFHTPTDIANRALQICGRKRIVDLADLSEQANEVRACYDSLRKAELERNLWTFATKRVVLRGIGVDTVIWTPPTWVSGSNYLAGAVVAYQPATTGPYSQQVLYWSLDVAKTGSTTTPEFDPDWHLYTGPVAIDLYNLGNGSSGSSTVYNSGEVVLVPATYNAATAYNANDVVNSGGIWYVSLIGSNTGNTPSTSPTAWVAWTNTGRGNSVWGVTATKSPIPLTYPGTPSVYRSLYNSNSDNPTSATANWVNVGGTITPLTIVWPVRVGPTHDLTTMNAFRLPHGFLKLAPTNPKGGQNVWLGAASGVTPDDWVIENKYVVSGDTIIVMRFVANMIDVPDMHTLFCEGLAARIADEVGPELRDDKQANLFAKIERGYRLKIAEARQVNAIEVGPISPVESRHITVRA